MYRSTSSLHSKIGPLGAESTLMQSVSQNVWMHWLSPNYEGFSSWFTHARTSLNDEAKSDNKR